MSQQYGAVVRHRSIPTGRRYEHVEKPAGIKGGFRITLASDSWWWSSGMYILHGYRPDQVSAIVPTTRLVLAHRHPADRHAMAAAWSHLIADGKLVAFHYRVVGADGVIRPVFAMASTDFHRGHAPTVVTGVMQLESSGA